MQSILRAPCFLLAGLVPLMLPAAATRLSLQAISDTTQHANVAADTQAGDGDAVVAAIAALSEALTDRKADGSEAAAPSEAGLAEAIAGVLDLAAGGASVEASALEEASSVSGADAIPEVAEDAALDAKAEATVEAVLKLADLANANDAAVEEPVEASALPELGAASASAEASRAPLYALGAATIGFAALVFCAAVPMRSAGGGGGDGGDMVPASTQFIFGDSFSIVQGARFRQTITPVGMQWSPQQEDDLVAAARQGQERSETASSATEFGEDQ